MKLAGVGAAGGAMLGASGLTSGCTWRPGGENGPNVVLVIMDSVRRDHVGAYGNNWIKTSNLDALAKDSLRFRRPYPESIPTLVPVGPSTPGVGPGPSRPGIPPKATG